MKRPRPRNLPGLLAGLGLLVGAALVLFVASWPADSTKTAPTTPTAVTSTPSPPAATPDLPLVETTPQRDTASAPSPTLLAGDAAREAIHELAITYDPAAIPALARYLDHPDAEIREAAREGLVNLGERAAIPALEAAARRAEGPEALALREAAEFLALPTWTERKARLKAESR